MPIPSTIAQLLVAAIQAVIQAIESKLQHEERVLMVVDPGEFQDEVGKTALELVRARARLVKTFGRESDGEQNT